MRLIKVPHIQKHTAQELSDEWPHYRVSSKDSEAQTALYIIANPTKGKFCAVAFI